MTGNLKGMQGWFIADKGGGGRAIVVAATKLLFRRHQTTDQTFTCSTNYETFNKVAIVRSCEKPWCTLITITITLVNDHLQKFNFHASA